MAEPTANSRDQTRYDPPSREHYLDDSFGGFPPNPEPSTVDAVPIVHHAVPVDEDQDLRDTVRVLQEQVERLQRQDQHNGGAGDVEGAANRLTKRNLLLFGSGVVVAVGITFMITFFVVQKNDPFIISHAPATASPSSPLTPMTLQPTLLPSSSPLTRSPVSLRPTLRPTATEPTVAPVPQTTLPLLTACAGFSVASTTSITSGIQGTLPTCLGQLTALRELTLRGSSQLVGSIPSQLGQLTELTELRLQINQLTGTLPPQLGLLTSLTGLGLNNNQLTGTIPSELGQLTALSWMSFRDNQLVGTIPSQMGQSTALTLLRLRNNVLVGTIPSELGRLTALAELDLWSNQLVGTIPPQLGQLTALVGLSLQVNQLTGTIPLELSELTALRWLWLQDNRLTGTVPTFVADIAFTDASGNNFNT